MPTTRYFPTILLLLMALVLPGCMVPLPPGVATKPTPQDSFSLTGSYSPVCAGNPPVYVEALLFILSCFQIPRSGDTRCCLACIGPNCIQGHVPGIRGLQPTYTIPNILASGTPDAAGMKVPRLLWSSPNIEAGPGKDRVQAGRKQYHQASISQ